MNAQHRIRLFESIFVGVCVLLLIDHGLVGRYETPIQYFYVTGFLAFALLIKFISSLSVGLAFLDLLGLLACVLWLLMPAIAYVEESRLLTEYEYLHMPIHFSTYFAVAIPGTLTLLIGLFFPFKKRVLQIKDLVFKIQEELKEKPQLSVILILAGFFGFLVSSIAPGPLRYLAFLLSQLIYVGACYLFFSDIKMKWIYYLAIVAFTARGSLDTGMFGGLIYWAALLVVIILIRYPLSFWKRLALVIIGAFSVVLLESVKTQYRSVTWFGNDPENIEYQSASNFELMTNIMLEKLENPDLLREEETSAHFISRFNQGRLTALAIDHTPNVEPYANGETIFLALAASFVPRILWPDKPEAGGKANFERFVGRSLVGNTSMNIAPLGDAYVNFGVVGGAFFLFFYGLFFSRINQFLIDKIIIKPTLLLWTPMIWVRGVVVETDVVTVFNHIVKSGLFILMLFFAARLFFKIKF